MHTHPVFLLIAGRRCVLVGGDPGVATKAHACLRAGGLVTLIAEELTPDVATLVAEGRIVHRARPYRTGDLEDAMIAYVSTGDPELVALIVRDASAAGVLLNVVDTPSACSFFAPAVVERGTLQIAVGTGGASPGLAARLRRDVARMVGPEYEIYVTILGAVRQGLEGDPRRATIMDALLDSALLEHVRDRRTSGIDAVLAAVVGGRCSLGSLGVALGQAG